MSNQCRDASRQVLFLCGGGSSRRISVQFLITTKLVHKDKLRGRYETKHDELAKIYALLEDDMGEYHRLGGGEGLDKRNNSVLTAVIGRNCVLAIVGRVKMCNCVLFPSCRPSSTIRCKTIVVFFYVICTTVVLCTSCVQLCLKHPMDRRSDLLWCGYHAGSRISQQDREEAESQARDQCATRNA
uniref:AlNc14C72G4919 protein n=1 Tax=Albugo laibachii Nc14 TaxID=890382 RepID=F0WE61_9STRA|nr:AlNc14C72G4919 [Albugo laibachii Nc14]|eukprot:CCA19490.1 AlNc14C72G4919 [Albugo laibachii Nc14]